MLLYFRFSAVSFSDSSEMEFRFNEHFTMQDVMSAINDTRFKGGHTRTESALDMMVCVLSKCSLLHISKLVNLFYGVKLLYV